MTKNYFLMGGYHPLYHKLMYIHVSLVSYTSLCEESVKLCRTLFYVTDRKEDLTENFLQTHYLLELTVSITERDLVSRPYERQNIFFIVQRET